MLTNLIRFLLLTLSAGLQTPPDSGVTFKPQEIARDFGITYAVLVADINRDRKPDIVAINPTQVVWFENPSWQKHIVIDGAAKKDHVAIAADDIDMDGQLDLALAADWQPTNTASGGSLQWLRNTKTPPWSLTPLTEEPTLHRIRFADVDGDGRAELIAAPLHGRGNRAPEWAGEGARLRILRVPKNPERQEPWPEEVADDSLHILHNFTVVNFDSDKQQEILTASREGIHLLKREGEGRWSKRLIGEGAPGEIKLGRVRGVRSLATVEPWHGTSVVIYEEKPGIWSRQVIADNLTGGHALGWGDFDADGSDELVAGWRDKQFGVALYRRMSDGKWERSMVDDGGMATEDLAVADLNGDGRPDILAGGRATRNIKIYWNQTRPAVKKEP